VAAARLAQRRAAKAKRRKQVLMERRRRVPTSLADKIRLFAELPLHGCLLHGGLQDDGMATVFLTRKCRTGQLVMAGFLIDAMALGIKDVVFQVIEPSEFNEIVVEMERAAPVTRVEPAYARKLVRDAAAHGRSLGLRPPRNFAVLERLFGDVRAEDCTETFEFGDGGRPVYVVGPTENAREVAERLASLTRSVGPSGFDFIIPSEDDDAFEPDAEEPPADTASAA